MNQETGEIEFTTHDLDSLLREIVQVRKEKEEAEEVAKAIGKRRDELQNRMISMLKQVGKKKWDCDGVLFYIAETLTVQTPKTIEDKRALWQYLSEKYGPDVAMDKFSVNSKTLNAFYNQEFEAIPESDRAMWNLPGVGEPTMHEDGRVKKS